MDDRIERINDITEALRLTALHFTVITAEEVRNMRGNDG